MSKRGDNQLSADRLRALIQYNPETGVFTWRKGGKGIAGPGAVAGGVNHSQGQGYHLIGIDRVRHRAHRLAFLYMTGRIPDEVDHINGDRTDNRWGNLRAATRSQNNANAQIRRDNNSGVKGVSWDGKNKKWRATINSNGKQKWLGRFASRDAAADAYRQAAVDLYGEFARVC